MILQILNPDNYHFTMYALPMLIVGVAIACLGFFVLIRERLSLVAISFLFMCLSVSLYQIAAALNNANQNGSLALLWAKIANLGAIFIPSSILLLTTALFGLTHRYRSVIAASIVLSFLFVIVLFYTDLFVSRTEHFSWGHYGMYGTLGFVFMFYFFIIMLLILRLYRQEYRCCTTKRQLKRYQGLLTAFIGGYFGAVDFLPSIGVSIYPFGYVSVGFFIAVCTYVLVRYRLVDITPELAANQILETMRGAVIVTGMEGRISVINDAALAMLGYPRSELIGRDLMSVFPISPDICATVQTGKSVSSREMVLQGRNRTYTVNISASVLDDASIGEPVGIVYVASDITELKEMQKTLRIDEERQRLALSASSQGWYDLNVRTGEVNASAEYARLLGYEPAEFTSSLQNWFAHIHPDDRPAVHRAYQDCLMTGGPTVMEYRRITKAGDWIWLSSSGKIVEYGADNKPLRMIGIHTDITGRKKAEEYLRSVRERLDMLLTSTPVVIYSFRASGDYGATFISDNVKSLLGFSSSEFVGRSGFWADHIHPEDRERVFADLAHLLETGHHKHEYRFQHGDGTYRWMYDECKLIRDVANNPVERIGYWIDITERKRAESELLNKSKRLEDLTANLEQRVQEEVSLRRKNEDILVQQSKMAAMGEMLGAIAHQWRQPLNTLGLIIQDLKDAHAYRELDKHYLETAVQKSMSQIQHMSKTIDDFRNFFRPDKEMADFDTMQAVGHVLSLISPQLAANNIQFQLTCHTHGKTFTRVEDIIPCREKIIMGYQNEFEQVILNMINNAREAIIERRESGCMPRNGHGNISFDFHNDDGRITIDVGNNGSSIPENIIDRIFEPYFTTKDPAKGTGLGLYMSKVIIEEHMHGRLTVKNSDPGVVFIVELPLS